MERNPRPLFCRWIGYGGWLCLFVLACRTPDPMVRRIQRLPPPEVSPKRPADVGLKEEDDIREVVFRHLWQHNESGQQKQAGFYFLMVGIGGDPSPELLQRFQKHQPPVRPVSASRITRPNDDVDRQAKRRGLVFFHLAF